MSDLIFPSSPVVGQTYMAPGGKVWRYGGKGWICLVDSGSQIYYNTTPPDDIAKYPLWLNTDTGDLMVVYQDVDSTQWIKIGTTGGGGGSGGTGGGATYLGDLNDVDTTDVSPNDVIAWNGTAWVPVAPAGAGSIDALSDVDTTSSVPVINNVLAWDNINWVPFALNIANWDVAYTHSQSAHAPSDADNTASNETSHTDVVVDGDFSANGYLERTSSGVYTTVLNKKNATTAPTVTDDSNSGYSIQSRWSDVTNDKEYVALDVTVGVAVWKETTSAGGGSALEIQDDGSVLTTEATLINFAGVGVVVTEPITDEILVTIAGGAGVASIDDLNDVDTTTSAPSVNDILEWNGTNWVPTTGIYTPVVYEVEITTATDTIDVPIHLLGGTDYRVELSFVNDNVATSTITHAINGDTTAANYDRLSQLHQVGDETYSDDTTVNIDAVESGKSGILRMHINAVNGVLLEDVVSIVEHSSNGINRKTRAIINNTTTFTTITSINFSTSVSTGFGVGTRLKILRD